MATIEQLRPAIEELEAEKVRLEALLAEVDNGLRFFRRRLGELEHPRLPGFDPSDHEVLEGMSLPEAMRAVIEGAGHPLHAKEIVRRLIAGGFSNQNEKTLKIQIPTTAARKAAVFEKTAPNTFGLKNGANQE